MSKIYSYKYYVKYLEITAVTFWILALMWQRSNSWLTEWRTCTTIPVSKGGICTLSHAGEHTALSNLFIALWFFTLFRHLFFISREKMTPSTQGRYVFINTAYWAWPILCNEKFQEKYLIVIVAICIKIGVYPWGLCAPPKFLYYSHIYFILYLFHLRKLFLLDLIELS